MILFDLMEGKERKIRLPGHPQDFGNTEAEEMARLFCEKFISFADKVEKASEFDDKITKVDYTIFKDGNPFLAVQQKFTESRERVKEAIETILKQPLIQLHNNQGEVTSGQKIPLVIIHDKLESWGQAYNRYLREELKTPLDALRNKGELKKTILKQMIDCLKTERYYFPQYQEIFDPRIATLEKELNKK